MSLRVVMMGASGAVGRQVVVALTSSHKVETLTLLNRRSLPDLTGSIAVEHTVDVLDPETYRALLSGHQAAVCTLGVGQPSAMGKEEFVRVDRDAVIAFATACKQAGIAHFELLGSVGANAKSNSFYLRTKGELRDALVALRFERLSIFQPSMILTPTNRYGISQGLMLAVWPRLHPLLGGSWKKYRGIRVETLGAALAANLFTAGGGIEVLQWPEIVVLAAPRGA